MPPVTRTGELLAIIIESDQPRRAGCENAGSRASNHDSNHSAATGSKRSRRGVPPRYYYDTAVKAGCDTSKHPGGPRKPVCLPGIIGASQSLEDWSKKRTPMESLKGTDTLKSVESLKGTDTLKSVGSLKSDDTLKRAGPLPRSKLVLKLCSCFDENCLRPAKSRYK